MTQVKTWWRKSAFLQEFHQFTQFLHFLMKLNQNIIFLLILN